MSSNDDEQDKALTLRKILDSKWTIWGIVFVAILLLCATATVTFAMRQRAAAKPTMYSPMSEVESKYDMAHMQVTSSDGLGVDAASTSVVTPDAGSATTTQTATPATTAPKIGPAPSANEVAPLQSVSNALSNSPVSLQAGVDVQSGASVNVNAGSNLNW
jgi:hypothetical protein